MTKIMKKIIRIPFDFVLERLERFQPVVKPMFGCHAIYIGEKIMLILRKKESGDRDNGVWVATTHEHHASLKKEFPALRSIKIFGDKESGWQNLPEESSSFEEDVDRLLELIVRKDLRIGKIPKSKRKKATDN